MPSKDSCGATFTGEGVSKGKLCVREKVMSKEEDGAGDCASDDAFTFRRHAKKLPDDVIISCVLSRLPCEDLFRCRLVCRHWRTTITSSPSFHADRLRCAPLEEPWLLIHHNKWWGECLVFNPNSSQWHKLCIGGVPIAAAGSFLIYSLVRPEALPVRFAVCNPFTNTRRELPLTHVGRIRPFVGAFLVHGSAHFKVVVAGGKDTILNGGGGGFWASTEVYDSVTDSWHYAPMTNGEAAMHGSWYSDTGVVCCDGIMYCLMTKVSISSIFGEYALMAYDTESGVWRMDQAYDPRRGVWDQLKWRMEGLGALSLVRTTGGLMLLGRLPDKGSPLCLWRLVSAAAGSRDVARWDKREVGSIPGHGQGLASAGTLYLTTQTAIMEWKDFAESCSPQWKMLSSSPRPPLLPDVAFLLKPGVIPISSCLRASR